MVATVIADGHQSVAKRCVLETLQSRWVRQSAVEAQPLAV